MPAIWKPRPFGRFVFSGRFRQRVVSALSDHGRSRRFWCEPPVRCSFLIMLMACCQLTWSVSRCFSSYLFSVFHFSWQSPNFFETNSRWARICHEIVKCVTFNIWHVFSVLLGTKYCWDFFAFGIVFTPVQFPFEINKVLFNIRKTGCTIDRMPISNRTDMYRQNYFHVTLLGNHSYVCDLIWHVIVWSVKANRWKHKNPSKCCLQT